MGGYFSTTSSSREKEKKLCARVFSLTANTTSSDRSESTLHTQNKTKSGTTCTYCCIVLYCTALSVIVLYRGATQNRLSHDRSTRKFPRPSFLHMTGKKKKQLESQSPIGCKRYRQSPPRTGRSKQNPHKTDPRRPACIRHHPPRTGAGSDHGVAVM